MTITSTDPVIAASDRAIRAWERYDSLYRSHAPTDPPHAAQVRAARELSHARHALADAGPATSLAAMRARAHAIPAIVASLRGCDGTDVLTRIAADLCIDIGNARLA